MAVAHGMPGRFSKSEAHRRSIQIMIAIMALAGMLGVAMGMTIANVTGARKLWVSLALLGAIVALGYVARRWVHPWLDAIAKERLKYMRGGQAEALVSYLLVKELPDSWHVFNNVKLERESDIDHVVVGPGGVFCISTKSQRGLFVATREEPGLLHNNQPSALAKQALGQAMGFKDRFAAVMGGNVPWVQAVLAVPFGFTDGGDACGGKVWVVHQEDLTDRLAPEGAAAKLNKGEVERAVKAIEMIQQNAASVYQRPAPAAAASTNSGSESEPMPG